ncbi:hypothetical protein EON76_00595 [bacterium]|nr:MAG: hypothetical protein EON76_00595 [bacterium]
MNKRISEYPYSSALEYPGARHENHFILAGEELMSLSENTVEAMVEIDAYLVDQQLPLLKDRVPVLAFGRNASPSGAATKAEKYSHGTITREQLSTIPMLKGTLSDHDVAWHGRPSQGSGYFAELLQSDDTMGTEVEAWVQFLTTEQLAAVHTTEGTTYGFTEVGGVDLGDGISIDAVGYTARQASVLLDSPNGRPIAVAGIDRSNSQLEVMDVRGALQHTLGQEAVVAALGDQYHGDAKTFFEQGQSITKLSGKKLRQNAVYGALQAIGLSRDFRYDSKNGLHFGRSEINSLPRGTAKNPHTSAPDTIQLMEQHVAGIRPSAVFVAAEEARLSEKFPRDLPERIKQRVRNLHDPAQTIRTRSHDELLDPVREQRLAALKNTLSK